MNIEVGISISNLSEMEIRKAMTFEKSILCSWLDSLNQACATCGPRGDFVLARATVGAARDPSLHRKYILISVQVNYHSPEVENHLEQCQ